MFKIHMADKQAEIYLYGDIGGGMWGDGITSKQFSEEMAKVPATKNISLRINSSGGDVFEGVAIYNQLKRHKATVSVDVDGAALSIASVVAMAASPGELRMADNAFMMIHDPWMWVVGGAEDLRKKANYLDQVRENCLDIYSNRTGGDRDTIGEQMAAETWFNASEAVAAGFATSVGQTMAVAACKDRSLFQYKNTPADLPVGPGGIEPEQWSEENKRRMAEIERRMR